MKSESKSSSFHRESVSSSKVLMSHSSGGNVGITMTQSSSERDMSPLTELLGDLRRKHVAAAGPQQLGTSLSSVGDVVDLEDNIRARRLEEEQDHHRSSAMLMLHHQSRTASSSLFSAASASASASSPAKQPADGTGTSTSTAASKAFANGTPRVASRRRHHPLMSDNKSRHRWSGLASSSHAENLLCSTPHLRHLSPASAYMQGVNGFSSSPKHFFSFLFGGDSKLSSSHSSHHNISDYGTSMAKARANHQVAMELAAFVRVLAHEMSLEQFAAAESEVFTSIFSMMHATADNSKRLAGVAALNALIGVPSSDEEKKAIKFANNLSNGLRANNVDYEFLAAVSKALGRMAMGASNIDYVEFEITRALEWLRIERSDRRLAATLTLKELAQNAPTAFYSKTNQQSLGSNTNNEFIDSIFPVLRDPQPIVRVCAADAISEFLKIIVDRKHRSTIGLLCQVYAKTIDGFSAQKQNHHTGTNTKSSNNNGEGGSWTVAMQAKMDASQHASLLVISDMLEHTRDFMLPRFDEVCQKVLALSEHPKSLIRLEVVRLIPRLARRCPGAFGRRYLEKGLKFILESAASTVPTTNSHSKKDVGFIDIRPAAFYSLGQLVLAMSCANSSNGVDEHHGCGVPQSALEIIKNETKTPIKSTNSNASSSSLGTAQAQQGSTSISVRAKVGDIFANLDQIFSLVTSGLRKSSSSSKLFVMVGADTRSAAIHCGADLVEALGTHASPYVTNLLNDMFESGLSEDLIHCLHSISQRLPCQKPFIEERLFEELSLSLAGTCCASDICDPIHTWKDRIDQLSSLDGGLKKENDKIKINMSEKGEVVNKLVLSLRTLGLFGGPNSTRSSGTSASSLFCRTLLPFVRDVVGQYLSHPSDDVRREAALTCCVLLLPHYSYDDDLNSDSSGKNNTSSSFTFQSPLVSHGIFPARRIHFGCASGLLVEEVLETLLRVAVSDPSPTVRHCVVSSLDDARYDCYMCQAHHLTHLFILLQDEALAVRAAALRLLGHLARLNPALILPDLRKFLIDLIIELRCGGDTGGGREAATRLLVVFLRAEALHRLVHPFLPSVIEALPLKGVAPRLASAAMEALGELAQVSRSSLNPWVSQLLPHILETMQDQSSASKQRTSIRTLGLIAGGTGYVISPYMDYPNLLSQAADVLPGTKRAPWALRREVIRTFGILGALDPDRYYHAVSSVNYASYAGCGGSIGSGYFMESETDQDGVGININKNTVAGTAGNPASRLDILSMSKDSNAAMVDSSGSKGESDGRSNRDSSSHAGKSRNSRTLNNDDDDQPAHLFMYELYAMTAQPLSKLPPARRLTPADDEFYPTVAVQALTRILKDSSLAVHHGMVMQAVMFIFNSLGLRCVPFLKRIVPHILQTVRTCGQSSLREALLQQVASLSGIVRDHLRPYVPAIFEVVEELWMSKHFATVLLLVDKMAVGVPDDFRHYFPRLVPRILASIETIQVADFTHSHSFINISSTSNVNVAASSSRRSASNANNASSDSHKSSSSSFSTELERLELVLKSICGLRNALGDYMHLLVPSLLKLTDSLLINHSNSHSNNNTRLSISRLAALSIQTVSILLRAKENELNNATNADLAHMLPHYPQQQPSSHSLHARAAQPLIRMLFTSSSNNKMVGFAIVDALCVCAKQLGRSRWMPLHHLAAQNAILAWQTKVGISNTPVSVSITNQTANSLMTEPSDININIPTNTNTTTSHKNTTDHHSQHKHRTVLSGLQRYEEALMQINNYPHSSSHHFDSHTHNSGNNNALLSNPDKKQNNHDNDWNSPTVTNNATASSSADLTTTYDVANHHHDFQTIIQQTAPSIQPIPPPTSNQKNKHQVNQANLQRAWDVTQRSTREDWDEWMRRFAVQLLREAPAPALRATAALAHAYQPLARELFSAAFVCCWSDLNEQYRENLLQSLETAFFGDVSPEILQTLLNLAEFMEHDGVDGGLPIDISILAELALKCRSYAKALHYKEREHILFGAGNPNHHGGACTEYLISINKKLDLPEAALGVLKAAQFELVRHDLQSWEQPQYNHHEYHRNRFQDGFPSSMFQHHHQGIDMAYSVMSTADEISARGGGSWAGTEMQESWLAKLGSWSEALAMYERKLLKDPYDVEGIIGCMRCLDARGEWKRVLELARTSWTALSTENHPAFLSEEKSSTEPSSSTDPSSSTSQSIRIMNSSTNTLATVATQAQPQKPTTKQQQQQSYKKALKFCAKAAWRLGQWDDLELYASKLVQGKEKHFDQQSLFLGTNNTFSNNHHGGLPRVDYHGAFYSAILHIHRNEWSQAAAAIDATRRAMDSRFTALMAESYKRAYPSMVTAQTLSEMEEIIEFRKLECRAKAGAHGHPVNRADAVEARRRLLCTWRKRLMGCRVDAEVHSDILAVRSLVLGPTDEVESTLTLSALSRQAQCFKLAERVLLDPLVELGADLNGRLFGFDIPQSLDLGLLHTNFDNNNSNNTHQDIYRLVTGEPASFLPKYGNAHAQFSKKLIQEAGGFERLNIQHQLYFAYMKHLWAMDHRVEAMERLARLCDIVDMVAHCENVENLELRVACWLRLGDWKVDGSNYSSSPGSPIPHSLQTEVLMAYKRSTASRDCGYQAWHAWALINFRLAQQIHDNRSANIRSNSSFNEANGGITNTNNISSERQRGMCLLNNNSPSINLRNHVVAALQGFVKAISIGTKRWSASVQQDMLNFLTCLFKYGELPEVAATINAEIGAITLESWLGVLPQLLARIHIRSKSVRSVLHPLLTRLGAKHPQALMYPLSVLLKSPVIERKVAAESLMNSLKAHSNALVEESLMVSSELIRVAILWLELWHEGLEDASRLYFGEGNVSGMLEVLIPLHEQLERGPSTKREVDFHKCFGRDLAEAHAYVKKYIHLVTSNGGEIPTQGGFMPGTTASQQQTENQQGVVPSVTQNAEAEAALNQAWDLYYVVFRRINKQLPGLTSLELSQCSPALLTAHNLELGVPGSYRVDGSYVKIERFIPSVQVITSKQRPRKIVLRGSDGKDYVFLLKGHEDLRQDERVMQLFGLVNALLARDRRTNNHDLDIQRYAIAPLSHNAGLVGWVPHCDTLHSLIRDYRESKRIPLNMEHREMMKLSPDYELLTSMQKIEIFSEALERTTGKGNDLYEVLWIKSMNSEEWLERRTKFTRSLAVMSMVGYILGLGDRHPSNLMLDQISGRVLHIDFGDCFEVAMHREKFPEKIPFRLTRMLIKAMEVSGIEGSYRSTCERTMSVLRDNRDSLVAMLEAFVDDPLISWRLLNQASGGSGNNDDQQTNVSASNNNSENGSSYVRSRHDVGGRRNIYGTNNNNNNNNSNNNNEVETSGKSYAQRIVHEPIRESSYEDSLDGEDPISKGGRRKSNNPHEGKNIDDVDEQGRKVENRLIKDNKKCRPQSLRPSHTKSLKIYTHMQAMAASLTTSSRIASLTGGGAEQMAAEGSVVRSRLDRSLMQKEAMSLFGGENGAANEEALNEKALKVIRRVQDKLTGTDFLSQQQESSDDTNNNNNSPLDVQDQVQRLIVEATSSENLCQLFIGWCAFW